MKNLSINNEFMRLNFSHTSGTLTSIKNKITDETYTVVGDSFTIIGVDFECEQQQCHLLKMVSNNERLEILYHYDDLKIEVIYSLPPGKAFTEKQLILISDHSYGLKSVVLSQPTITGTGLEWVQYRQPSFELLEAQVSTDFNVTQRLRPAGFEPCKTFFGRTNLGGLMVGVELAFDASYLDGNQLTLVIQPNLKVKAGECLALEPMYLGVYFRGALDECAGEWQPNKRLYIQHGDMHAVDETIPMITDTQEAVIPLPSESQAMVALTTAVLGGRKHHTLAAIACGWHSEMTQWEHTAETVSTDQQAQGFLVECGADWLTDSHPWGGEIDRLSHLQEDEVYTLSPLVRTLLEHGEQIGLKTVQWASMNQVHPWLNETLTFLHEKSEWLRVPAPEWQGLTFEKLYDCWPDRFMAVRSHCLANTPFWEWITRLNLQALDSGQYAGWVMDGDFWGTGGFFQTSVPVVCYSDQHDHLPGDANYACQKALEKWVERILEAHPELFITMCRPVMDLGVWALRNVDACFTLVETGTSKSNLAGGNEIRLASRIRVHQHFFPHYLDWPLLFPSYANPNDPPRPWSSEKLDYILLSAMSCSPNLLLYLPARSGIPQQDKEEIRKWLDWGRANLDYLLVRKDLFDWTSPGKVDGSVHWLGNEGIIFLFNPNPQTMVGVIELTDEVIEAQVEGDAEVWQEYPVDGHSMRVSWGETVQWEVPAEGVVVLRMKAV
jgi:hypothetical protein